MDWEWLGRQPYRPVHRRQLEIRRRLIAGEGQPALLLVEHEPVVTLGRRAGDEALNAPRDHLLSRGVAVEAIERGGLATYHGPGQLVGYPILSLPDHQLTVPAYVALLEDTLITYAGSLGLAANRRKQFPGVWVGRTKIGAIGLHLHRDVSIHGFAFNLTIDPSSYRWILPCGIRPQDGTVSSVKALLGGAPSPEDAAPEVARLLLERLDRSRTEG